MQRRISDNFGVCYGGNGGLATRFDAREVRVDWLPFVDAFRTFCFTTFAERRTLLLETQWFTALPAQSPNQVGTLL